MAYPTIAVANAFIAKSQQGLVSELSPMKLQKLMFYAQSWHLKIYNEPLFDDFFAKWQYGPVVPSLYHQLKNYGSFSIANLISTNIGFRQVTPIVPDTDAKANDLINRVINVYGKLRATQLSALTHMPGTAWSNTPPGQDVIDNNLLKECIK